MLPARRSNVTSRTARVPSAGVTVSRFCLASADTSCMATATASMPRARSMRLRPSVVAVLLCAAAAALYVWMRVPVAAQIHAHLTDYCDTLAMQPGDWPCRLSESSVLAAYAGGSLLVGLALALPGVILAASGRRFSALVPVSAAGAATMFAALVWFVGRHASQYLFGITDSVFIGSGEGHAYWQIHGVQSIAADLVLVCVPALAVAFLLRPARGPRPEPLPRHAAWLATFTVASGLIAVRVGFSHLPSVRFVRSMADTWISATVMLVFGALLGTDRRWWPWALVPVAVMLSLGPTMLIMSIPTTLTAFSWFAGVVPLVAAGFVGSLWRPIAERFAGRHAAERTPRAMSTAAVRPTFVLNSIAVALLALSMLAVRTDPLPIQISTVLPTYLGERALADDVRTKLNLGIAIEAMEAYRAEHGSFMGFDGAAGERAASELEWVDGASKDPLVVGIVAADEASARVVASSGSGSAFCMQAVTGPTGASVTYGSAGHVDVDRAIRRCGSTAWTPAATRMFDVDAMCSGAGDQVIIICRAVQRLIRTVLASPTDG
jgi:hypothetical protein